MDREMRKQLLTRAVFVDLDSTLADTSHRHHQAPEDRSNQDAWTDYSNNCHLDEVVIGTRELVNILGRNDHYIVICSSRSDVVRKETEKWLSDHGIIYDELILQDYSQPYKSNADHKIRHIAEYREKGYDVVLALEDWPPTARAIEAVGVPVVCINPRYEEGYFSGGSPL